MLTLAAPGSFILVKLSQVKDGNIKRKEILHLDLHVFPPPEKHSMLTGFEHVHSHVLAI